MLDSPINKVNSKILKDSFDELEKLSNSDVIVFCSEFTNEVDNIMKEVI